jgi:hypothetical protein
MDELLTTQEAAALVGMTDSRIRQLIRASVLVPVRRIDKAYMLRRGDVEAFAGQPRRKAGRPRKQPDAPHDAPQGGEHVRAAL